MIKRAAVCVLLTFLSVTVFAHRLNEYLQAAAISLSAREVYIQYTLTPGVDMADALLRMIDRNNDGHISKDEQQRYLAMFSGDVTLILDGNRHAFKPVHLSFPTILDTKKGVGDITMRFKGQIGQWQGAHHLQVINKHYNALAVYLVNCLLPTDSGIRVTDQTRSADQSTYDLNFTYGISRTASFGNGTQQGEKGDGWPVVKTFILHGIKHILTGYDHLLFLCALVLGVSGFWDLIKIITVFTFAHSITLTLATFSLAHLPEQIVEPIIATSIIIVAVQNILLPRQAGSIKRMVVAFIFGLFHGFGFAGSLTQLMHAMPNHLIICAIVGFSLGVETGNQLLLLPAFGMLTLLKRNANKAIGIKQLRTFQLHASAVVAVAGACYLLADLWKFVIPSL